MNTKYLNYKLTSRYNLLTFNAFYFNQKCGFTLLLTPLTLLSQTVTISLIVCEKYRPVYPFFLILFNKNFANIFGFLQHKYRDLLKYLFNNFSRICGRSRSVYHIFLETYHLTKTLEIFLDFFIIKKVSFKRFIQQYVDGLYLWIIFFQKIAFNKKFLLNFNKIFLDFSDIIKSFFWKIYSTTFLEFLEDPDTWISFSRKISFNKNFRYFSGFHRHY